MGARPPDHPHLPAVLAAPRRRGRDRPHRAAGPRRHGVRGGFGTARHLRALRDHGSPGRVRRRRSEQDPRPWSRLLPGPADRGHDPAPGRRQRGRGRRPGRHARHLLGPAVRARRAGPLRVHRRPAVQSRPLWLHERDRPDRAAEPAAEALRLLHRRRGRDPRGAGARRWGRRRRDERGRPAHRGRLPARHPGVQAVAAEDPRGAGRGGRGDGRRGRVRAGGAL
jgi:hypothetical protein